MTFPGPIHPHHPGFVHQGNTPNGLLTTSDYTAKLQHRVLILRQLLRLFLPTLIPSWRFFEEIGPSARIEYRVGDASQWVEALPRPPAMPLATTLGRLFWNPDWNEYLYLTTCAERIVLDQTDHSVGQINTRLIRRLNLAGTTLQFRLVFISDDGSGPLRSVEYESAPVYVA